MTDDQRTRLKDLDAERTLLGSILLILCEGRKLDDYVLVLQGKDFSNLEYCEAFNIALDLHADGKPVDQIVLADAIMERAKKKRNSAWSGQSLDQIRSALDVLMTYANPINMKGHADIVKDKAKRRLTYDVGLSVARSSFSTNGQDPIASGIQALEKAADGHRSNEFEFYSAAAIADLRESGALPEMPQLVEDTIPGEGLTLVGGDVSSGKTFALTAAAIGIVTGVDVWGKKVLNPGPVLMLAKDTPRKMIFNRVLDLCEGFEVAPPDDLHIAWCDADEDMDLSEKSDLLLLRRQIEKFSAVAVVIDDLTTYAPGVDSNNAGEIGAVLGGLRKLSNQTGASFLIAHLLNKGNVQSIGQLIYRIGGSVHIPGKVDLCV